MRRLAVILYSSFAILFLFAAGERAVADRKWEVHRFVYAQSHRNTSIFSKPLTPEIKRKPKDHKVENVGRYVNDLLKGYKEANRNKGPPPVGYTYTSDLPVKIVDFSTNATVYSRGSRIKGWSIR
jgi:hypothetical protein